MNYVHEHEPWNGQYECPVCHSDNLYTDDSGGYDDYYYYDMYCEDCGALFRQRYRMVPAEVSYSTKEEQEQDRQTPSIPLFQFCTSLTSIPLLPSTSPLPSMPPELPPDMPVSVPPSELPHVELRHNYDLAPVSDNPLLDVLSQCQSDTATRNLRMPKANWQAINEALSDS